MRQIRQQASYGSTALVEELGWSTAKVSKLETGWRGTSELEFGTLLGRCGTDKPNRDRIMHLVREQHLGQFVRPHQPELPDDLLCLTIHERTAATITCYEPTVVPALLQAKAYALALLATVTDSPDTLCSVVQQRTARQAVLDGEEAPKSIFYIHETVLDLRVGSVDTMHDQMKWLTFVSDWAHVAVRVIPTAAGGHHALRRPVTLLTFAKGAAPLAYGDMDVSTVFEDGTDAIESHRKKFAVLDSMALDVEESRHVLAQRADAYDCAPDPLKKILLHSHRCDG